MRDKLMQTGALCLGAGLITSAVGLKNDHTPTQIAGLLSAIVGTLIISGTRLGQHLSKVQPEEIEPLVLNLRYGYEDSENRSINIHRRLEIDRNHNIRINDNPSPEPSLYSATSVSLIDEKLQLP